MQPGTICFRANPSDACGCDRGLLNTASYAVFGDYQLDCPMRSLVRILTSFTLRSTRTYYRRTRENAI